MLCTFSNSHYDHKGNVKDNDFQRERNPHFKVLKVLDCVIGRPEVDTFQTLLEVLDREHPWAAKELRNDLRMERGQLQIDEDIMIEANILINR